LNRNSHVRVGSNGSRNWRVIGKHKPVISSVATKVFANGPGASLTDSHEWVRSERSVSEGENDVSSEAMDDVGVWRLRIRDLVALHFRRTRCGIRLGRADSPGTFVRASMSAAALLSRKAR
jgi:hypothetical protein